ncbi:AAA family ATPase [Pseudenhygromyxa sp. WMMC2535]|uniref:AAA family ATPase n=1 Tax=Pseudenhygromyxa sp. WMMC2535 TaxID=2712867 RepID=UPI001552B04E|nr:AAA family ATPase [Pseudenhygromyxa sp. WMMC2535]NVB41262.1 AAA family ATPase [Pseudenhygromyxa sp. WMMC2535]
MNAGLRSSSDSASLHESITHERPPKLPGYVVRRRLGGVGPLVDFELEREADGRVFIARVFAVEGARLARVEYELGLLCGVEAKGLLPLRELVHDEARVIARFDALASVPLATWLEGLDCAGQVKTELVTKVALDLACGLERAHALGLIHGALSPAAVRVDPRTSQAFLFDFGVEASGACSQDPASARANRLGLVAAGARPSAAPRQALARARLAYRAPEQIGLIRRSVDARSDLYALGAVLYELLSGQPPFAARDTWELIFAQRVRRPEPLAKLRGDAPGLLSAVVMRLLAKDPKRRYQSAAGLRADLEAIAAGAPVDFVLGRRDLRRRVQAVHRLIERERELERIEAELVDALDCNETRMVLLSGPVGIGKTALMQALERPQLERRGLIAAGRFRPLDHEPYHAFVEAGINLVDAVLTENEVALREWAARLRVNLGTLAPVMTGLLPQLRLIFDEREQGEAACDGADGAGGADMAEGAGRGDERCADAALDEVVAVEADPDAVENRLRVALARFLSTFGERGPLVLVLDDLQWADGDSVELIRFLLDVGIGVPMLIVAGLRRDEVGGEGPLADALVQWRGEERVVEIALDGLSDAGLAALIAEHIGQPAGALGELVELVGRRSANNPLAVRALLEHLVERGLLDIAGGRWDLQAIAAAELPEGALGLMTARLAALPEASRRLLSLAACVGAEFEVEALEAIGERRGVELAAALHELRREGLLAVTPRGFRFAHPRLCELSLAELAPAQRRTLRVSLGVWMLARARRGPGEGERDESGEPGEPVGSDPACCGEAWLEDVDLGVLGDRLFELVDALDEGVDLDASSPLHALGPRALARLNLAAGERAMGVAAWESARVYLEAGCRLLSEEPRDELAFAVEYARAQALALTGARDQAEARFEALLEWPLSLPDLGRVTARRIRMLALQGRTEEAVALSLQALARCGWRLSSPISKLRRAAWVMRGWRSCAGVRLETLAAMPEAADPRAVAAMYIVIAAKNAAFVRDIELFEALCGLHGWLVMRYGFHPAAPVAFAQLGVAGAFGYGEFEAAGELCDYALELCARVPQVVVRPRAEAAAALLVWPTCRRWSFSASRIPALLQTAREVGDLEVATQAAGLGLGVMYMAGTKLEELVSYGRRWHTELERWGTCEMSASLAQQLALAEALRGAGGESRARVRALLSKSSSALSGYGELAHCVAELIRAEGLWLLGRREDAVAVIGDRLSDFERALHGSWQLPRFVTLAAVCVGQRMSWEEHSVDGGKHLRRFAKLMRRWARGCAENFAAGEALVDAERARARGRVERALACYERAQSLARDNGLWLVEIMACERLAELAFAHERSAAARGALDLATEAARRWGAQAVEIRLLREHEEALGVGAVAATTAERSSNLLPVAETIDIDLVLATSQLIAEELRIEEIITRLLDAALSSSDADEAQLVLDRGGVVCLIGLASTGERAHPLEPPVPLEAARDQVALSVVHYVRRTGLTLSVEDARIDPRFAGDPYVIAAKLRSLLCLPLGKHGEASGVLVLSRRDSARGFASESMAVLQMFLAQAANALDNARLYEALQRSEAHWRSLVDGVPDIISLLDRDGTIEFVNHLAPYEVPPAALIGVDSRQVMSPTEGASWSEVLDAVVDGGEMRELEVQLHPAVGGTRYYGVRVAPIFVAGEVGKFITISTDITIRKKIEAERAALDAQMRQQQRLESIATLARGVAHEINNPIQGIMNYAELIAVQPKETEMVLEFAQEITLESSRVATIVSNLLAFSRQEPPGGDPEPQDMAMLIESTLSLIRAILRKDQIDVTVEVEPGLPLIACRGQQIQQVIMNLISNARDAINGGQPALRSITIRAHTLEQDGQPWLRVSVEDRGKGIDESVRGRIFDPFFTTKGRDQGTGLGLAVSHGIALEHGGELGFETRVGEGTCFHLDLPLRD